MHLRIATLNLGHQTRKQKAVPTELLDALLLLDADLLFLTEYVNTPQYEAALRERWPHVAMSEQLARETRSSWSNQVAALSRLSLRQRGELAAIPTQDARTNFLCVEAGGLVATGLRAPAYEGAAWYDYWERLGASLESDVVIGDLNVDPRRGNKRDRVLPAGWTVSSAEGVSYRHQGGQRESAVDHALVRRDFRLVSAEYRPEFFGKWGLDHCPLVAELARASV